MRQNQDTQKRSNLKSFIIIGLLLLLVAVIGFGGYTLSKYLTSKKGTGTATVAKWGFTIDANADNLFGSEYKWDATSSNSITTGEGSLTVKANTANPQHNVVAPGTSGSMTFSISGTAEVLAEVKIQMTVNKDIALVYGNDNTAYNPVVWTLTKDGTQVKQGTLNEIAAALNKTERVEAGVAFSKAGNYTLSWAWAFESGNDALDTTLGLIANGDNNSTVNGYTINTTDTKTEINFTLVVSATQLAQ